MIVSFDSSFFVFFWFSIVEIFAALQLVLFTALVADSFLLTSLSNDLGLMWVPY
jgi:hypothetical protein